MGRWASGKFLAPVLALKTFAHKKKQNLWIYSNAVSPHFRNQGWVTKPDSSEASLIESETKAECNKISASSSSFGSV